MNLTAHVAIDAVRAAGEEAGATTSFCGLQSEVVPKLLRPSPIPIRWSILIGAAGTCAQLAILGIPLVAAAVLDCSLPSYCVLFPPEVRKRILRRG